MERTKRYWCVIQTIPYGGGIIGDDGIDGIALGPEVAEGEAFVEFQKYIKSQQAIGVLLAINSKNDLENAKGYLRSLLAKQIDLRKTPELRFKYDESLAYGNHIDHILENLKKQ